MEFEGDSKTLVIRDFIAVIGTQHDFSNCHVSCEHLIEMSTLFVGLSAGFECASEIQGPQFLYDISHVVVKVTTYDYRSIGVLSYDVSGDFNHPFSSLFQVRLFSRLKIAVENLNVLVAELQLSPTEIGAKCLH